VVVNLFDVMIVKLWNDMWWLKSINTYDCVENWVWYALDICNDYLFVYNGLDWHNYADSSTLKLSRLVGRGWVRIHSLVDWRTCKSWNGWNAKKGGWIGYLKIGWLLKA